MSKESFLLFKSFYEPTSHLSSQDKGKLYDAIFQYQITKKEPKPTSTIYPFFLFFKNQFRLDNLKYEKKANANRSNGLKGGRPKKDKNPKNPLGLEKPKKAYNVNVNDNVNVNVNDNEEEEKKLEKKEIQIPNFVDVELWNEYLNMRKKKKALPTEKAVEQVIKKLVKFENNKIGAANEALENSIESNYTGVFEPKNNFKKEISRLAWKN